ncbi:syntaxin 1B/2/3/4 [Exophiala viscosa]|uniref:Syntaxin 1B/2/3/4 n=1 Tax=Exophiala viscosa TaxID=2486360 RepID=A0AAN6IE29_9EURO|nr:syntaxin 1B/2/3/4 [Exophiala viscosa]
MSYNQNYSQQGNQAYGTYNPYGQGGNPYDQVTEGGYNGGGQGYNDRQGQGYSAGRPQAQAQPQGQGQDGSYYADEEQRTGGYEMRNMNGNDPNRILNECRGVDQAIDEIEADLQRLKGLQSRYLADTNTSAQSPLRIEVDRTGENIMTKYRGLVSRVKNIKQQPESGNPRNAPQVGKVDRRLKTAINQYQQVEREFRKASQEQMARQYRIVRPDASDAEVREAVEDPNNQQIFSSALIQSDRRGEAQTVARNVSQRHEDIQKIERQMIELAQLFQDLEALVVQQEPAVTQIEQRGEEVTEHVSKANVELDGAVKKARAARRKKWICLGIVVLIIIILAIVLGVVFGRGK